MEDQASEIILCCIIIDICTQNETKKKRKRFWMKDWYNKRVKFSHVNLLQELEISSPMDFKNFLRMDIETYKELLEMVKPIIEKEDTLLRDSISPNERLSATLRFLASGQSFEDLKFLTAISPQSLGKIVMETARVIKKVLQNYIKIPQTEESWKVVSNEFARKWNFPNCIGALDGKHVEITKPPGSGSYYFNYKKSFSIVLFAVVNANYEFIMVDIGMNGRISDGGIFGNSKLCEKLEEKCLNIPESAHLPGSEEGTMPFVFVGDDAFPLLPNLMKPYSHVDLTDEENIFNYRLSRARRIVENAFGILSSRFRILLTTIKLKPSKVSELVLTTCYLHNFLRRRNPNLYLQNSVDIENTSSGEIQPGSWRSNAIQLIDLEPSKNRNASSNAKEIRNKFCTYFNTVGAVPWQNRFTNQLNTL